MLILASTQLSVGQSRDRSRCGTVMGILIKCQGAVSGRVRRTSSGQLATDASVRPGPRISATRARTAVVSWASAIRATRLWPSTPQAKTAIGQARINSPHFRMRLLRLWQFAHKRQQIAVRVAKEGHPQIVVRHSGDQVRLLFERDA